MLCLKVKRHRKQNEVRFFGTRLFSDVNFKLFLGYINRRLESEGFVPFKMVD